MIEEWEGKYESIVYKEIGQHRLKLLICMPPDNNSGRKIGVMWVHGGGFTGGEAHTYIPHCRYMALRGMCGISVEYRLVSEKVTLLDSLRDVADAVLYLRAHTAELGLWPGHIIAVGDSAGGYLVTALATVAKRLGFAADSCPDAIVNCNGVVDLTGAFMPYAMGREKELSPMQQVYPPLPPMLHLQGKLDRTVLPQTTEEFHLKCRNAGGLSELIMWPDAAHAFIVPDYTATEEQIIRAVKEIEYFIRRLWLTE